jgi:NADH:ubiquinone oxidoreductase subunit C
MYNQNSIELRMRILKDPAENFFQVVMTIKGEKYETVLTNSCFDFSSPFNEGKKPGVFILNPCRGIHQSFATVYKVLPASSDF